MPECDEKLKEKENKIMRVTKSEAQSQGILSTAEIINRGSNQSVPFLQPTMKDIVTDVLLIPASYIIEDDGKIAVDLLSYAQKGAKLDKKQLNLSNSFLPTENLPEDVVKLIGVVRNLSTALFTAQYRAAENKEILALTANTNKYAVTATEDNILDKREQVRLEYFGSFDEDTKKFKVMPKHRQIIDKVRQSASTFFVVIPLETASAIPNLEKAVLVTHELTRNQLDKFKKLFKELNANEAEMAFVDKYELPIFKLKRATCENEKECLSAFDIDIYPIETSKMNPDAVEDAVAKAKLEEGLKHILNNMLPDSYDKLVQMSPLSRSSLSVQQVLTAIQSLIKNPQQPYYMALLQLLGSINTNEGPENYFAEEDKWSILALFKLCESGIIPRNADIKLPDIGQAFKEERENIIAYLEAKDLAKDLATEDIDKSVAEPGMKTGEGVRTQDMDTSLMDDEESIPAEDNTARENLEAEVASVATSEI